MNDRTPAELVEEITTGLMPDVSDADKALVNADVNDAVLGKLDNPPDVQVVYQALPDDPDAPDDAPTVQYRGLAIDRQWIIDRHPENGPVAGIGVA